jgi:hypothetical protein
MKRMPPEFCDFDCPHADFPPANTAGICRTMSAVWCRKLKELVNKNTPCEWHRRQQTKPAARRRTARGAVNRNTERARKRAKLTR